MIMKMLPLPTYQGVLVDYISVKSQSGQTIKTHADSVTFGTQHKCECDDLLQRLSSVNQSIIIRKRIGTTRKGIVAIRYGIGTIWEAIGE